MRESAGRLAGGWRVVRLPAAGPQPGHAPPPPPDSDLPFGDPLDEIPAVEVAPESLKRPCEVILEGLSEAELKDSKAVLVEKGQTPGLGMLSRTQDLSVCAASVCGG